MPKWLGAVFFGAAPFGLLGTIAALLPGQSVGLLDTFVFVGVVLSLVFALSVFYISSYLRREIGDLLEYALSMQSPGESGAMNLDLSALASLRKTMIPYALLLVFTVPVFTLGGGGDFIVNLEGELPYLWFNFILATFFWTFGYSMYSIHRMGKLPLTLKSHTEDKTLGLKPFGKASLNSTLIYFGVVSALFAVVATGGAIPVGLALLFLGMFPIGLVLFLLPLRILHRKLNDAKQATYARIAPRYLQIVESVSNGAKVDQNMANEMAVVVEIRNDILQIHSWPFDTGVFIKLAAIVLSVSAILLSALIRDLLHI